METIKTIEELQAKIDELSADANKPVHEFLSVSPNDDFEEMLSFETTDETHYNFVTDWEL